MFALLAVMAQIWQISGGCVLFDKDFDHGEDYMSWTSVYTLSQCKEKCKSTPDCYGITWVKNNKNRNCALYDFRGTESGVVRRGQESYLNCGPEEERGCPAEEPSLGARCSLPESVNCEYGEECCCGKCSPSLVLTCSGGSWLGYYTDACLAANC